MKQQKILIFAFILTIALIATIIQIFTIHWNSNSFDSVISNNINAPHNNKLASTCPSHKNIFQDVSLIPPFPIDVVYTFAGEETSNGQRLRYNGELRYSLRSIYKYIPWVNAIYIIISDDTKYPSWIIESKTTKKHCSIPLHFIRHSEIFWNISNAKDNHNSIAIESRIHHISGLSNHYIYFNDDVFLFQCTSYLFFFNEYGIVRFPKSFYWNYYTNPATNPIITHPAYSIMNQKRLKISYRIPYRMSKLFAEHMARVYTRNAWFLMENTYHEWFKFVESHKKRFCSSRRMVGCFEEDLYLIMTSYRVLHSQMKSNKTLVNITQTIDGKLYDLLIKNEFEIDIFKHNYKRLSNLHVWLTGTKYFNVGNLRKFTEKLIKYKPHIFCANDVLKIDTNSTLYFAEIRFMHRFYRKYLGDALPFEKRNFIELNLRKILTNLSEQIYDDNGTRYKMSVSRIIH